MGIETLLPAGATKLPTAKYIFVAIVVLLLAISAGQWYLLGGLTSLYLGVPLWLWLQLGIVVVMLALAWAATSIWTVANNSDRPADADSDGRTEW
jgi:membrane protein DedA with SNARE-associated domain